MPRKKRKRLQRVIAPDAKYGSVKVAKFINRVMLDGKKRIAERIVYGALDQLASKSGASAIEAFEQVLKNVMPLMEVKSRRVGGSTYQVPIEVNPQRATTLAMRWIIGIARSKKGKSTQELLADEMIDSFNNVGASVKKREDTHKMAEANKAFAHFRW